MDPVYIYPEVDFWTPIVFDSESKSCGETLIEIVDSSFHLWGRKACVFDSNKAHLSEETPFSLSFSTIVKIILLVFIPITLVVKACLRYHYRFQIIKEGHVVPLLFIPRMSFDGSLSKAVEEIQTHDPEVGICQLSRDSENNVEKETLLKQSNQLYIVTYGPITPVFSPEGPYYNSPVINSWIEVHKAEERAALHYLDPVRCKEEPLDNLTSQFELNTLKSTTITIRRHQIKV